MLNQFSTVRHVVMSSVHLKERWSPQSLKGITYLKLTLHICGQWNIRYAPRSMLEVWRLWCDIQVSSAPVHDSNRGQVELEQRLWIIALAFHWIPFKPKNRSSLPISTVLELFIYLFRQPIKSNLELSYSDFFFKDFVP